MTDKEVSAREVVKAFAAMGEAIGGYEDIEIVLVGGMAARLAGWIDSLETTQDCDVMVYMPESQMGHVEQEAFNVGQKLGLPANWFNSNCRIFEWVLPPGWERRKRRVGQYGLVGVTHVGRCDVVALKVFASRDRDREPLIAMKVTAEEIDFAEHHLGALQGHAGMTAEKMGAVRETIKLLRNLL
jgi:hypothetical protein